ncbi:hypothetical protein GPECTOR_128g542 [Gonium pectorale]|uniref:UBC core domain-containing protein n=1 Tax=Gonium pectorale TaxID=33097 RepID=A0A150FYH3_GONPE|nr:hypothetical protein GPECTOR_128g542 [Gonium pectorale]|eukprot:KXZ42639.1 hypothetical protein GPECTOR_128g542 [Gonium pectorale]
MAAQARLAEERKLWRKDHPPGMVAKPSTRPDGSVDLFCWDCRIPGLKGTYCEGGMFPVTIRFSAEHPHKPPQVQRHRSHRDAPSRPALAPASLATAAAAAAASGAGLAPGGAGAGAGSTSGGGAACQGPGSVFMPKGFLHVNVFDNGGVCLSILKEVVPGHLGDVSGWRPNFTVKAILVAVQELLSSPNFGSIANWAAHDINKRSAKEYAQRMKAQTEKYIPKEEDEE